MCTLFIQFIYKCQSLISKIIQKLLGQLPTFAGAHKHVGSRIRKYALEDIFSLKTVKTYFLSVKFVSFVSKLLFDIH